MRGCCPAAVFRTGRAYRRPDPEGAPAFARRESQFSISRPALVRRRLCSRDRQCNPRPLRSSQPHPAIFRGLYPAARDKGGELLLLQLESLSPSVWNFHHGQLQRDLLSYIVNPTRLTKADAVRERNSGGVPRLIATRGNARFTP